MDQNSLVLILCQSSECIDQGAHDAEAGITEAMDSIAPSGMDALLHSTPYSIRIERTSALRPFLMTVSVIRFNKVAEGDLSSLELA